MRHAYIETIAQGPTDSRIQGDEWNADHVMPAVSADLDDPATDSAVTWMSDGTGSGDYGDIMAKINVGGTTLVVTFIDFSTKYNGLSDEDGNLLTDEDGNLLTTEETFTEPTHLVMDE